jgi:hypothetical protein
VPAEVKDRIKFIFADSADEVLQAAFSSDRPRAATPGDGSAHPPPVH